MGNPLPPKKLKRVSPASVGLALGRVGSYVLGTDYTFQRSVGFLRYDLLGTVYVEPPWYYLPIALATKLHKSFHPLSPELRSQLHHPFALLSSLTLSYMRPWKYWHN